MFLDTEKQWEYIKENYPDVTDSRIDEGHWDLFCQKCNRSYGFQVVERAYTTSLSQYGTYSQDFEYPFTICFRCPGACHSYKFWIVFSTTVPEEGGDGKIYSVRKYYRVSALPSEGIEDLEALPEEPKELRKAYRQAVRAMDANAHIAAAAMFRRALQVITRKILGTKPSTLANELKEIEGKVHNGVKISQNFSDNAYIIKESGNQGAHPDHDQDLLDFTAEDAQDLQYIFMELVSELFVSPEAARKAKQGYMDRRKILLPGQKKQTP